jgi:hypothetical protein
MADESNPDLSNEETPFSSPINEDKHSFEPTKFSTDENDHNDLHIEPIQNGDHQENPSNIQTVEPNENHFNETEFIQETTTNHQEPTSPSHIQPIHFSDEQDSSHSNQNSLEESNTDITLPTQTDLQEKLEELKLVGFISSFFNRFHKKIFFNHTSDQKSHISSKTAMIEKFSLVLTADT